MARGLGIDATGSNEEVRLPGLELPATAPDPVAMRMRIARRAAGLPEDLGRPDLPGSKSHTQRAMLAAAFLSGEWRLAGALRSDDTEVLAAMLRACGAGITVAGRDLLVRGRGHAPLVVGLDAGENGTAARMLAMIVPLLGGRLVLDGAAGLRARPFGPALAALRAAGVVVEGDRLPLRLDGSRCRDLPAVVDASLTTQPASGALLAAALRGGGELRALRPADPGYLELTTAMLRAFGFTATASRDGDDLRLSVHGRARDGGHIDLPVDPSARVFPLVLAAMWGRDVRSWWPRPAGDPHPDWDVDDDLAQLLQPAGQTVRQLPDLARRPDCMPALAALALAATGGWTRLPPVPALRHKESDRLAGVVRAIDPLGTCRQEGGALLIEGRLQAPPHAVAVPTPRDHRVVMAFALLGSLLPHGVVVDHAEAVAKSWPSFWDWLGRCADVGPA